MKKSFLIPCVLLFLCCTLNAQTKDTTKKETHVEEMPEFPGGPREMMLFIQKNIQYPKHARKNNITGKCFIRFVIMKDGALDSVRVIKGVADCPECDEAAVGVIKKMPKWNPGKIDGKPVPVNFNIPINFTGIKKD